MRISDWSSDVCSSDLLGGKMVPFAGYEMPVQYPAGILKEHLHTRARAWLFDVSHMGQLRIRGDAAATAIASLVPGDLRSDERRAGKACVSTCSARGEPYHSTNRKPIEKYAYEK